MILSRFIFKRDLVQNYMSAFNKYMVQCFYGNILIGSEIVDDYKEE